MNACMMLSVIQEHNDLKTGRHQSPTILTL